MAEQLQMFDEGEAEGRRVRFWVRHHFGRKLTAAAKVLIETTATSALTALLAKTPPCDDHRKESCAHPWCLLRDSAGPLRLCRPCKLCGEFVTMERQPGSWVATTECRVGAAPPQPKPKEPLGGYVYFVLDESNQAVKIGYSARDPEGRLASFQVGHPSELRLLGWVRGELEREKELHRQFKRLRIRGEWFRHEGRLATFIKKEARRR